MSQRAQPRRQTRRTRVLNALSDSMMSVEISGWLPTNGRSAAAEGMALYREMFLQTLDGQNRPTAATEALLTNIFPEDGENPSKTTLTP